MAGAAYAHLRVDLGRGLPADMAQWGSSQEFICDVVFGRPPDRGKYDVEQERDGK